MGAFLLRFFFFMVIWTVFLFPFWQTEQFPFFLFACAASVAAYFFLPVVQKKVNLYLFINSIILILGLVTSVDSYQSLVILLMYLLLEGVFRLSESAYRLLMMVTGAVMVLLLFYWEFFSIPWFIVVTLYFFVTFLLNQAAFHRAQSRELYEQLLEEYRRMKRQTLENEKLVRLEERTRIAREIHDSVGHKLTALLMQIEIMIQTKDFSVVDSLKDLASDSLAETREAVSTLHIEEIEGVSSIIALIRKLESENGMSIVFTTKQGVLSVQLNAEQSIVLYRVIQESLTNAMKHTQSRRIEVSLGRTAKGDIDVNITNPLTKKRPFQFGFGLTNMEGRLREIGGNLRVYQTEDSFMVNGSFPVEGRKRT
ncbi:sensor histidine kinase [Bacillus sp. 2205SS5-2]|uniref:sensor histidine kinase n=1 Tax=Bacillus sp. 2205SS5-2 TaxID=3109031 RepID=UPI003005775A